MRKRRRSISPWKRWLTIALFAIVLLTGTSLTPRLVSIATHFPVLQPVLDPILQPLHSLQPQAALAQRYRSRELWRQVYAQIPDLPLENQYTNRETGDVSPDNTLISRLIRYHIYTKIRPPNYRLDWKLTLADYLGVNERIDPVTYPGADTLRPNPASGDIAAMQQLNRSQRDALVQTLTDLFSQSDNTGVPTSPESSEPAVPVAPVALPSASPPPSPQPPREPQPGDAQLLAP